MITFATITTILVVLFETGGYLILGEKKKEFLKESAGVFSVLILMLWLVVVFNFLGILKNGNPI